MSSPKKKKKKRITTKRTTHSLRTKEERVYLCRDRLEKKTMSFRSKEERIYRGICKRLNVKPNMKMIHYLRSPTMDRISLRHSTLGDKGCRSLTKSLNTIGGIVHLDLGNTGLTRASGLVLGRYLKTNQTIRTLALPNNRLSSGVDDILPGIRVNRSLTHLDLSANEMSFKTSERLVEVVESSRSGAFFLRIDQNYGSKSLDFLLLNKRVHALRKERPSSTLLLSDETTTSLSIEASADRRDDSATETPSPRKGLLRTYGYDTHGRCVRTVTSTCQNIQLQLPPMSRRPATSRVRGCNSGTDRIPRPLAASNYREQRRAEIYALNRIMREWGVRKMSEWQEANRATKDETN